MTLFQVDSKCLILREINVAPEGKALSGLVRSNPESARKSKSPLNGPPPWLVTPADSRLAGQPVRDHSIVVHSTYVDIGEALVREGVLAPAVQCQRSGWRPRASKRLRLTSTPISPAGARTGPPI
jgi:hypothetical protein